MMMLKTSRIALMCGLGFAVVGVAAALAQDNPQSPESAPQAISPPASESPTSAPPTGVDNASNDGLLSGPKVGDDAKQPRERERGRTAAGGRPPRDGVLTAQRWHDMLLTLGLTDEQKQQIEPLVAEFTAAVQAFEKEYGARRQQLVHAMREARQSGQEFSQELKDEMRKISELSPRLRPHQEKIWALLTPEQQKQFTEKIEAFRKQIAEARIKRVRQGAEGMGPGTSNPDDPVAKERRQRQEQLRKQREQQTNPSDPMSPADPETPANPATPATPGTLATPGTPGTPETPPTPAAPAEPGSGGGETPAGTGSNASNTP